MKITSLVAVFLFLVCVDVQSRIHRSGKGRGLWIRTWLEDALENLGRDSQDWSAGGCPDAKDAFDLHNKLREKYGVPPLDWDNILAERAQDWAHNNAAKGMIQHTTEEELHLEGENLGLVWVGLPELENTPAQEATKMWIEEELLYNVDDPSKAAHFTQMIWRTTRKVGLGCAKSGDMEYVCARYNPRGNFDSFTENVQM